MTRGPRVDWMDCAVGPWSVCCAPGSAAPFLSLFRAEKHARDGRGECWVLGSHANAVYGQHELHDTSMRVTGAKFLAVYL